MELKYLPEKKVLLDSLFNKSRKDAGGKKHDPDFFKSLKSMEIAKIEAIGIKLSDRLAEIIQTTPKMDELHPFYKALVEATIDIDIFKKALFDISSVGKIAKQISKEHIRQIKTVRFSDGEKKVRECAHAFYGRIFSATKHLDKSIKEYNECARKLKELPNIDFELPTIVFAGYPNAGKSTLMGRITISKPKVAAYPFTTQGLMVGYFEQRYRKIQIIDTPGLLDRPMDKRNPIEQKAISALKYLAKIIVFMVDPTANSGYSLEEQFNLLKEVKKFEVPIIVAINKADIASAEEIKKAIEVFEKAEPNIVLEGENQGSTVKEKIIEMLKIPK